MANISIRNGSRSAAPTVGARRVAGASPAAWLRATVDTFQSRTDTHPSPHGRWRGASPAIRRQASIEPRTNTLPSPQGGWGGVSPAAALQATVVTLCVSHRHPPVAARRVERR